MHVNKTVILGAGLAGLSASYHLGHHKCVLFEKNHYAGGHIYSYKRDGFVWDEGPHISFTKNDYVKNLFHKSVNGNVISHQVGPANYFHGHWIPHPAQSNLYAIPQPLRSNILKDFLASRQSKTTEPQDYREWLTSAFGNIFYEHFSKPYTQKYWTVSPEELATDWIGKRIYYPKTEEVQTSYYGPLSHQTHYITGFRYPAHGGYLSFANALLEGSNVEYGSKMSFISFREKKIIFNEERTVHYDRLINTIPLPVLIENSDAPAEIKQAASRLNCTSLLLVNVTAKHPAKRPEKWIYVYDQNKYTTRLSFTEGLSPENGARGQTGIQVEVYFSPGKQKSKSDSMIAQKVAEELVEMGLIQSPESILSVHTKWVPWANIIFDHQRRDNQDKVLSWLEQYGLVREKDDLEPVTNWPDKDTENIRYGPIVMAGRYGQWKYFWTDDCVLRGKILEKGFGEKS